MDHKIDDVRKVKSVDILNEICTERLKQDSQWGGAEHDDTHDIFDWCNYIEYQTNKAKLAENVGAEHRNRLMKVAALAIAAIESIDRKMAVTEQNKPNTLQKYMQLLVKLQQEVRENGGEGEEAKKLRNQMDVVWSQLTAEECNILEKTHG